MKEKILKAILLLIIVSCSLSPVYAWGKKDAGLVSVNAGIVMFGTAPGLFPGLVTDDGRQYSIKIAEPSAVTMQELLSQTGKQLVCTGRIETPDPSNIGGFEVLKDGTFFLSSFTTTDSGTEHK